MKSKEEKYSKEGIEKAITNLIIKKNGAKSWN